MTPQFGRCPCPDIIKIEDGPTLNNLVEEINYLRYYQDNPEEILRQSMYNNTYDSTPLGGNYSGESLDNTQQSDEGVENLKEEINNEESFNNTCYIVVGLLLLALIIAIMCKFT